MAVRSAQTTMNLADEDKIYQRDMEKYGAPRSLELQSSRNQGLPTVEGKPMQQKECASIQLEDDLRGTRWWEYSAACVHSSAARHEKIQQRGLDELELELVAPVAGRILNPAWDGCKCGSGMDGAAMVPRTTATVAGTAMIDTSPGCVVARMWPATVARGEVTSASGPVDSESWADADTLGLS
ncbi:hypothetical protein EXIGLDRAFT_349701 [Exidia glandulosa HHB12029]|uniref:Uncharacterized protein n=1 Tax=Exidia glandulosa HHB12029 TaxID=1314781 RepID=A0A165CDX7_EXIGL|nr:hypothetical protein EXIGLDRAFT_349701 [Exidia glandulosa HHB12029]